MATKRLAAIFTLVFASTSLLYACSAERSDPAPDEQAVSQSLVYDGFHDPDVSVGEAFAHDDDPKPRGLGYSCLEGNAEVNFVPYEDGNDRHHEEYRGFVAYDLTDAVDKLRWRLWPGDRELKNEWPGGNARADEEAADYYEKFFFPGQTYSPGEYVDPELHRETLSILIYIRTVMEDIPNVAANEENEFCPEGYESVDEFEDSCGDTYLGREIYGGYVLVTVDIEKLTSEQRDVLYDNFLIDTNQHEFGVHSAFSSDPADQIEWQFHGGLLNGLRPPNSSLLTSSGTLTGDNLVTYLDNLRSGDGSYIGYEDVANPAESYPVGEPTGEKLVEEAGPEVVGNVIQQDFRDYPLPYLDFCGTPLDGYSCYTDFFANEVQINSLYQEWRQKAQFELQNDTEYCWGPDPAGAQARHADFLTMMNDCNSQILQTRNECTSAFNNGEPEGVVCDFCGMPPACDREDVEALRAELVEPVRKRPNGDCWDNHGPVEGGNNKVLDATSDSICVLSGIGGKFASDNESVKLDTSGTAGSGGPAWYLEASSQYPAGNTNTFGRALCVPKSMFQNGKTNTWLTERSGDDYYNGNHDRELTSKLERAATLNGVAGDFRGGGEWAHIVRDTEWQPNRWDLRGNSSSGALLRANYTTWGLDLPTGDAVNLHSFPGGERKASSWKSRGGGRLSKRLDDSDVSLCYLRKFQGRFDGRGEWIRIDQGQSSSDWYLTVRGACKKSPNLIAGSCDGEDWKRVEGSASCYKYDQSN